MVNVSIGKKLKDIRKEKEISRPKFCAEFNSMRYSVPDLVERTLKSWENGEHEINSEYLQAFCDYFNVDMSYWFDDKRIAAEKVLEDISEYTGLSENAIRDLHEIHELFHDSNMGSPSRNFLSILNELITSEAGKDLLDSLWNIRLTMTTLYQLQNGRDDHPSPDVYNFENLYSWERTAKYNILEATEEFQRYIYDEMGARTQLKSLSQMISSIPIPDGPPDDQ